MSELKKVYKIRKKGTVDEFLSLGYNSKSSWSVYPSAAINYNQFNDLSKYEVVLFEYELKEVSVVEMKPIKKAR